MRHSMHWSFVACAVLVMSVIVAMSARLEGAEPSSSPLDPEFEFEYRETLREIRRLQEEVGHLRARRPLEEVGAEEDPAPEEPVEDLVPAIKIGQLSNFGAGLAWSVTVGWEFQPTANVEVAELGVWDIDGKGHSVDTPVGIFDLSGKEIARVSIPSGNTATLVDNFRYMKIDPVELRGGERYTILALYTPETKGGIVSGGGANIS